MDQTLLHTNELPTSACVFSRSDEKIYVFTQHGSKHRGRFLFSRGPLDYRLPKLKRKERAAWVGEWDLKILVYAVFLQFQHFEHLHHCVLFSFIKTMTKGFH